MNSFGIIKKMFDGIFAEVKWFDGTVKNKMIMPKGVYCKPKDEAGIVIQMNGGDNKNLVMPIQMEVDLQSGDVVFTDNKSKIHFKFKEGDILLKTKNLVIDAEQSIKMKTKQMEIDATTVDFGSATVKSKGKHIDASHVHQVEKEGKPTGGVLF